MPLPVNWKTITVTATYLLPGGGPAAGSVKFMAQRSVGMDDTVVLPDPITAALNASGQISVGLPCPNDTAAGYTTLVYQVIERVPSGRTYYIELIAAMPATQQLAEIAPVETLPAYYSLQGPPGAQGPAGPQGTVGDEYGVVVTHATAIPLGGYAAALRARASGAITRLLVDVNAACTLRVVIGGTQVAQVNLTAGLSSLALSATIAVNSEITFVLVSGTPTYLWAQIDGGTP